MIRDFSLQRIAAGMAVLLFASVVNADLTIETIPNSVNANVGEEITVTVQMTQDGLGSGELGNALTTGFGLTSFGFELTTTGTSFSPSPTGPTESLPNTWVVTPTTTTLSAYDLDMVAPIEFNPLEAPVGTPVVLGRFTFVADAPGTTVIDLADLGSTTNFGFDNVFTSLDSEIFNSASSVTLTAVPEPSSVLYFALLGLLTTGSKWSYKLFSEVGCN